MKTNNISNDNEQRIIGALSSLTPKQRKFVRLVSVDKVTAMEAIQRSGYTTSPNRALRRMAKNSEVKAAMQTVTDILNGTHEAKVEAIVEKQESKKALGDMSDAEFENHGKVPASSNGTDALRTALREIIGDTLDEKRVTEIVRAVVAKEVGLQPTRIEVVTPSGKSYEAGLQHKKFPRLMLMLQAKRNVYLAGPAGTGKTTAGREAAKALSQLWERPVQFYFNGAIDSEHKLLGFVDAQGRIVSRPFREAFTNGGLYLFDEVDASMPSALLAFNAALSNGHCDFPDGCFEAHPDFRCMAAANTWGFGATHDYVGRAKLDEAFRNRFAMLNWDTDETLERHLALREINDQDLGGRWITHVQQCRAKAARAGVRCVISPRASIGGCALLQAGDTWEGAEEAVIRMGMADESWKQISA
jgi:phage terminase small subunit